MNTQGFRISQIRKDFSVYVVEQDEVSSRSLSDTMRTVGYDDTKVFPTLESALDMIRTEPPHIVLLDYERFEANAENFLIEVQAVSSEILVVLMVNAGQMLSALQLTGRGLTFDSVIRPFVMAVELVQKLDRAAGRLYFQFETEQIREYYELKLQSAPIASAPTPVPAPQEKVPAFSEVHAWAEKFQNEKELEATIQIFMDLVGQVQNGTPVLYFKYMPAHISILLAQVSFLSMEKFRGIGVDLKTHDPQQIRRILSKPKEIEGLRSIVAEVFRKEAFAAFSHINDGDVIGVFVVLDMVDVNDPQGPVATLRRLFELAYKRNLTIKEKHVLDINDSVTGLYNRKYLLRVLDQEIARSRRILMPVSLVTLSVDGADRMLSELGSQGSDTVMKAVAMILRKTARTNDVLGRMGASEFATILPHTGHMGAAVKAERLRRVIESTKIPALEKFSKGVVTVSVGVSEYPSFCSDADALLKTSDEALSEVRKTGGNKACLASAPAGFKLDFTPQQPNNDPKLAPKDST